MLTRTLMARFLTFTFLLLATLVANAASYDLKNSDFAQGLEGWKNRMDNCETSTVNLSGGPAATALRVHIKEAPAKPWFIQLRQVIPEKIYPGEVIEVTAMMRSPDNARAALALQLARPPFSPLIFKREDLGPEWKKVSARGKVNEILAAGDGQVVISLGFGAGTVEITNVQVDFPNRKELTEVPAAFKELSKSDEELTVINPQDYPPVGGAKLPAGPYRSILDWPQGIKPQGEQFGEFETVPVTGQHFQEAVRMTTLKDTPNYYSFQLRVPIVQSIKEGDTMLALFSYRVAKANPETGYGASVFALEKSGGRYDRLISWGLSSDDTEWHHCAVPFKADLSVAAGGANVIFRGGYGPQTIEIGGVALVNFGAEVNPDTLPGSHMDYIGSAPDAPWRKEAEARIEKYRKGDFTLKLTDAQGRPLKGAKVKGKLKRHLYGFGTTLGAPVLLPGSWKYDAEYGKMAAEMFNAGSLENSMKWKLAFQPDIEQKIDDGLAWMEERGWRIRGHNMVWPDGRFNAPEVNKLQKDPEALRQAILDRIQEVGSRYAGQIDDWDVINEPYTSHTFMDILGDDAMSSWMQAARAADPYADLYVNDFGIVTRPGTGNPKIAYYMDLIDKFQSEGTPMDGLGLQAHFHASLTPIPHVYDIIDGFAQKGLKVQLTELTLNVPDEQTQADYVRDFVTVAFSHPSTNLVQVWGFWEGYMWEPIAAMYHKDWSPKPLAESFRKLVQETYTTDVDAVTDAQGEITFRGFYGDYVFTVENGGKTDQVKTLFIPEDTQENVSCDL